MAAQRPAAIVLAPSRHAISGVSTHANLLLASALGREFALIHFQVGSEGRSETPAVRAWRLLWSPIALALRILLAGAAVVHINTSLNRRAWWRDLAYLIAARLCGARVVYQVHGGDLPRRFAARHLPAPLLRKALRLPDAVVVLASGELAAYREFVPGQRILAMPNGIDFDACRARRARPPRRRDAPFQLLYVGRLARGKGLAETFEALALARRGGVSAELTVAGSGSEEAPLRKLAMQLGIADAVRFVGPVFAEAKRALFESAEALLLPSHSEGLPYTLLEAMAAGLPVIATPVGAIPDVVDEGVHGLLVPVGDTAAIAAAIAKIAARPALVAAMGIAARRRIARRYTVARLAQDFAQLYRGLCPAAPAREA